jgi:hypothetical protein
MSGLSRTSTQLSESWRYISGVMAFSASGRLIVIVAMWSATSKSIVISRSLRGLGRRGAHIVGA